MRFEGGISEGKTKVRQKKGHIEESKEGKEVGQMER